jgi:type IV secretion system protein VirD4
MSELILGRTGAVPRAPGFASRAHPGAGELITYSGEGHLITFAPTGTGKTSGPVICNALKHPGQLIVLDIKGEIYAKTGDARRAMGQQVHVLDLRDGATSDSLNPLDLMMRSGTDVGAIARSFAVEIIERGAQERDRFWTDWSETMITGGTAWLLSDCEPAERRISKLFDLYTGEDVIYKIAVLLDLNKVNHRTAKSAFTSFLQLPERDTRPSVLGTTQTHIRLFDSDLVRRVTDTSSIDIDALIAGKPMSIYIIVPPLRLTAYSTLLRLWLSGLILSLTQRKDVPKDRTLMLVDEVGNLGKMDALLTAATLMRSWGLSLWTFWQNASQLQIYGAQANTLVDNAGVIQVFGVRNQRMAQDIANIIGGIAPEQIMKMRPDEQLLLIESKLLRAKQSRHYSDIAFTGPVK